MPARLPLHVVLLATVFVFLGGCGGSEGDPQGDDQGLATRESTPGDEGPSFGSSGGTSGTSGTGAPTGKTTTGGTTGGGTTGSGGTSGVTTTGGGTTGSGGTSGATTTGGGTTGGAATTGGTTGGGTTGGGDPSLAGYWVGTHVSYDGGGSFQAVVRGNAVTTGTDQRDFIVGTDGTMIQYAHPTTGSVFLWKLQQTALSQSGSTSLYSGNVVAQGSCNHGDWTGSYGSADGMGEWGSGTPLYPGYVYRFERQDETHTTVYLGYPTFYFHNPSGARSTTTAQGAASVAFKLERTTKADWTARVPRPTGSNASPPPPCTAVP